MTASQKILVRQLKDSVLHRFGSISRMCRTHHLRDSAVNRFLNGDMKKWDDRLYDILHEMAHSKFQVNNEIVLFDKVIRKYFGSYQAFCTVAKIHVRTFLQLLKLEDPTASPEFIRISWLAYSKALHEQEGINEYVTSMPPAKFLRQEQRRMKLLMDITKADSSKETQRLINKAINSGML